MKKTMKSIIKTKNYTNDPKSQRKLLKDYWTSFYKRPSRELGDEDKEYIKETLEYVTEFHEKLIETWKTESNVFISEMVSIYNPTFWPNGEMGYEAMIVFTFQEIETKEFTKCFDPDKEIDQVFNENGNYLAFIDSEAGYDFNFMGCSVTKLVITESY